MEICYDNNNNKQCYEGCGFSGAMVMALLGASMDIISISVLSYAIFLCVKKMIKCRRNKYDKLLSEQQLI